MSSYTTTTTQVVEQPSNSAPQEVEVQQYSMPTSGGHITGQVTSTHYEGPQQITETRSTTNYVQQGGQMPSNYVQQGGQMSSNYVQQGQMSSNYVQQGQMSSSYVQQGGQTSSYVQQGGQVSSAQYSSTQGGYQQSIQGNYQTATVSSRPSSSYQIQNNSGAMTTGAISSTSHTTYPQVSTNVIHGQTTSTSYPSMQTATHVSGTHVSGGQYVSGESTWTSGSRVVTGEEHVIGYNEIRGEERVISERIVEHEIKVPKKIVREEVIEKVIVVPETITREEVIEEVQVVKETVIEVARPIIQEKIVEVPEIEYQEKIVEKVEKIVQEKIKEVPVVQYQERVVEVPKYITQERVVEVPEIEYRDVIVEKVVEVPEIREQVVVKEVPVPQYVEKPVPEYVNVEQPVDVERNIPVPVEAITTFEYQLAQFRPRVNKVQYPLYVPRFVEVPVSAELFDQSMVSQLQAQNSRLQMLQSSQAIGLCEIENMATEFRRTDVSNLQSGDIQSALSNAFKTGRINMRGATQQMTSHTHHSTPHGQPLISAQVGSTKIAVGQA